MKKRFLMLALLPTVVFADPQTGTSPSAVTPPAATGNPHACGTEWYPPAALAAGEEGKTTLSFRVGVDGSPKNISVAVSSGFQDLDQAAIQCAATWKYLPAVENGQPREVDWKAAVEWSMAAKPAETVVVTRGKVPPSPSDHVVAQQPLGSQVCKNPMAPPAPLGKITVVLFQIDADGGVRNIKLYKSSGDDKLDQLALTCVSLWRYTPLPDTTRRSFNITVAPIPW